MELASVPAEKRTARFKCSIVFMTTTDTFYSAEGVCNGRIIFTPRGVEGFGYDPLFVPDGFDRTFAELSSSDKHTISHRGKALEQLRRYLDGSKGRNNTSP
jgi:XTP/dITP diphosphohydrolase